MFILHLGRMLGVLVLIGGLPAIMMVVSARGPSQMQLLLAVAACMIAALWVVVRCDRALRHKHAQSVGKKEALGQEFSEARLVVGMRWPRWLLAVTLRVGMGILAVLGGTAYGRKDLGLGIVMVAAVFLLACMLWTHVLQAARAVRCGYLLCVDQRGFHVAGECFVPWSQFCDAAVKHRYWLQLVVDPSAAVSLKGREGEWPWQWGRPSVAANGRVIQVPLHLLAASPHFLEGAVYGLCKRYATAEFWDRNESARMERWLEKIQRDLNVLNSIRLEDIRKMPSAKQEEILQAGLDALNETSTSETARGP